MEGPVVDRAEFFRIADEIVREGRQPSQRSIRDRLVKGGSFSELGPLYVEWATTRGFSPRMTKTDLPDYIRDKFATVAAEIWREGLRNGALGAENELDKLRLERDALKLALAEAAARADAFEDRANSGRSGIRHESDEPVQAPGEVGGASGFWDRVMQEVFDLLGNRALESRDIFAELRKDTAAEAARRDGAWSPGRLAHKMRTKIKKNILFKEEGDGSGVFSRRA
jgi:hypothetical protein